ncbi:L10-interacting MYB domain-containing protein-like [Phalaenopsis equestris]|uniref:L10-interacting MYB domain-containing protein-like n=1 Tax=Phalaenopsis equestris TaxID=78828 RepID=UPI0009E2BD31|nr:L10-interacting MYB domain-containing protein-like [Phalaenopsis equestris]
MDSSNDAPHKVQKTSINEVVAILEQDPSIAADDELYYFAVELLQDSKGREYDRLQMKNKWDQLKKDWKFWKDLKRGSTGLCWDPIKRTIDVSKEWWCPQQKKYKTCGIEPDLEEKLDIMFGGVVAIEKYACTPSEMGFGETQDNVVVSLSDDSPEFPSPGPTEIQSTNHSKRSRFESKKKRLELRLSETGYYA